MDERARLEVIESGSVITTISLSIQPFASVTISSYVPTDNADMLAFDGFVIDPDGFVFVQLRTYGIVPPDVLVLINPVLPPLHCI